MKRNERRHTNIEMFLRTVFFSLTARMSTSDDVTVRLAVYANLYHMSALLLWLLAESLFLICVALCRFALCLYVILYDNLFAFFHIFSLALGIPSGFFVFLSFYEGPRCTSSLNARNDLLLGFQTLQEKERDIK